MMILATLAAILALFSPCRRGRRLITEIGERLDGDNNEPQPDAPKTEKE